MQEEPEYYPEDKGWIHEDDIPNLTFVKNMLTELTCSIYKTGDVGMLECALEEILASFEMKIPTGKPLLQEIPKSNWNVIYKSTKAQTA